MISQKMDFDNHIKAKKKKRKTNLEKQFSKFTTIIKESKGDRATTVTVIIH